MNLKNLFAILRLVMKILLICEASWTVVSFRKELIEYLNAQGHETFVITGDEDRAEEIRSFTNTKVIPYTNRSINPIKLSKLGNKFKAYIKEVSPDVVMSFFIKPNTVGVKAAYKAGVRNIFPMVEGLGDPFQPKNFKGKIIRFICTKMYRSAFKKAKQVFFLNNDDSNYFIEHKICKKEQSNVIPGIGIDSKAFNPEPLSNNKSVLMMSRLIESKGVYDFCQIARKVRETNKNITFNLLGKEAGITKEDLKEYIDNSDINYLGATDDVKPYIKENTILALPSFYREGLPRSILEAMAMGRPVVAYKNVGVNDCVFDKETGILVESRNIEQFASEIINLLNDKNTLEKYSKNARLKIENTFDSQIINKKILEVISK